MRRSIARGTSQTDQQPQGRHAAGATRMDRPRPRGRRRWLVVAAAVAAFSAMIAPPPTPVEADVDDAAAERSTDDGVPTLPELSAGAPAGAITLASAPAHDPDPEPATPAVITGLAANGIPNVALNAYRVAAARMESAQPSCGIDWSLLAGIGRVESNHGRYGGAVLNSDGTASPKILGPALNGVKFAFIGDSDNGQWDGDTSYDRAMGPMQFIPTTWRAYAIDADGNGSTDPFNINDAALAAANYLCTAGGDLRTVAGQREAVFAYNHSDSYVNQVLAPGPRLCLRHPGGRPAAVGRHHGRRPGSRLERHPGRTRPGHRRQRHDAVAAGPGRGRLAAAGAVRRSAVRVGQPVRRRSVRGPRRWRYAVDGHRRRWGTRSRPGTRPGTGAVAARPAGARPGSGTRPRLRSPCRSRFRRRLRRRHRRPRRSSSKA